MPIFAASHPLAERIDAAEAVRLGRPLRCSFDELTGTSVDAGEIGSRGVGIEYTIAQAE